MSFQSGSHCWNDFVWKMKSNQCIRSQKAWYYSGAAKIKIQHTHRNSRHHRHYRSLLLSSSIYQLLICSLMNPCVHLMTSLGSSISGLVSSHFLKRSPLARNMRLSSSMFGWIPFFLMSGTRALSWSTRVYKQFFRVTCMKGLSKRIARI